MPMHFEKIATRQNLIFCVFGIWGGVIGTKIFGVVCLLFEICVFCIWSLSHSRGVEIVYDNTVLALVITITGRFK